MGAGQFITPIISAHKKLNHRINSDGQLVTNLPKSIITLWEPNHGWTKYGSDPNTTVADDTETFRTGSQGLRLTDTNSALLYTTVDKDVALDMADKNITLDLYVVDYTKINYIAIYFSVDRTYTTNHYYEIPGENLKNGWNSITFNSNAMYHTVATLNDLRNTKAIRIKMLRKNDGQGASIVLDRLYTTPVTLERGKITLTFDDAYLNTFTVAKPMMDVYGFPGVAYIPISSVGNAGRMTLEQLKILQDLGWDIASHGYTHKYLVDDPQPSEAEIRSELLNAKQWLIANGFAKGSQHYALPGGQCTNDILKICRDYYATIRTTRGGAEPYPNAMFDRLRVGSVINTTSLNNIDNMISNAVDYKQWVIFMFHVIADPASVSTQILPATFQYILDSIAVADVDVVTMSDMVFDNGLGLNGYNNYLLTDITTGALTRLKVDNGVIGVETI